MERDRDYLREHTMQGTHCTGKMVKKIMLGKTHGIGNFAKTQGIWFAQVVKFPDSKGKRYFDICDKNVQTFFEAR